jgi:hypothetical protein
MLQFPSRKSRCFSNIYGLNAIQQLKHSIYGQNLFRELEFGILRVKAVQCWQFRISKQTKLFPVVWEWLSVAKVDK